VAQVQADPYWARAEQNLAEELLDYQAYAPAARIAKFSGEPKYEGEARAEVAISYLLHEWRNASPEGPVVPSSNAEMFAAASRTTDHGATRPGIIAQQSPNAWAATSDRAGHVKFAWQPEHDDWFFSMAGQPSFLPSTSTALAGRNATAYSDVSDGVDATASLLTTTAGGYAGMTTLPTGSVVYATSGTGSDEGKLSLWNLDMGDVRGLDGNRTYAVQGQSFNLPRSASAAAVPGTIVEETNPMAPRTDVARLDTWTLPSTTARYVRAQGITAANQYAMSIWEFEVRNQAVDQTNLARETGVSASASVENTSTNETAAKAIDGSFCDNGTSNDCRWGMPANDPRRVPEGWFQLDFGAPTTFDEVKIYWEGARSEIYLLQTSDDGVHWENAAFRMPTGDVKRVEDIVFTPTTARYVQMMGVVPHSQYGYSLFEFEAKNGAAGPNLAKAAGVTASASSTGGAGREADLVRDASYTTRWCVSTAERSRADSWIQLDFGAPTTIDRVRLAWESAAAGGYAIRVSDNGTDWTSVATWGEAPFAGTSSWLAIDDRVSLVKRSGTNPIAITHSTQRDTIVLSSGPAAGSAGLVVEGYPLAGAAEAELLSARPKVTSDLAEVVATDADGYLSVFNLSPAEATATLAIPGSGAERALFAGEQVVTAAGTDLTVTLAAATSAVLAPRFILSAPTAGDLLGLTARVDSGRRLVLRGGPNATSVTVAAADGSVLRQVAVPQSGEVTVAFDELRPYPLADLAVGRIAYPTTPLPPGMTDPDLAVDDDPATDWIPGSADGRMVVDLGQTRQVGQLRAIWGPQGEVPAAIVQTSTDGLTYVNAGQLAPGRVSLTPLAQAARFVAIQVSGWDEDRHAGLATLSVYDQATATGRIADELETDGRGAIARLDLTASDTQVDAGRAVTFGITAVDPYGNPGQAIDPADVTFTSSEPSDAIDAAGRLLPVASGTRTVTAEYGGVSGQVDIDVTAGPATRLRLTATPVDVVAGTQVAIQAHAVDAYGNVVAQVAPGLLAFESLATGETVAADGTWTALEAGDRVLTAALADLRGSVTVTVRPGPLDTASPVTIVSDAGPGPLTVQAGASLGFAASGQDAHGNELDASPGLALSVTSGGSTVTDPARVTVAGTAVTFLAVGTYSVRAAHAASGASLTVQVTVTPAAVVAVDFTAVPPTGTVVAGGTVRLSAIGRDAQGNTVNVLAGVERTSSAGSDALAGDTFRLTEAGPRTLTVSALLGDGTRVSQSFDVTVTPGTVARLKLATSSALPVVVGEAIDLAVTAEDAFGNQVIDVTASATYASSRAAVDVFSTSQPGRVVIGDAGIRLLSASSGVFVSNDLRVVATSDAPVAIAAPAIVPAAPRLGQSLTVTPGTWAPAATSLTYQWLRDGTGPISGATGTTYVAQGVDVGHTLAVQVTAEAADRLGTGIITTALTAPVGKAIANVQVTLPGPVVAGQTPSVDIAVTGAPTPATGTVDVEVGGQMVSAAVVAGAASVALPVLPVGTYQVRVTYSGDANLDERTVTAPGLAVVPGAVARLVLAAASGGPVVAGETIRLTVTAEDAAGNALGDVTASCTFTSSRAGVDVFNPSVPGEVRIGDAGVRTLTAAQGALTSNALRVVATSDAPQSVAAPAVTPAAPRFGQELLASPGAWSPTPTDLAYQWLRDGSTPIAGATSAGYTVAAADVGHTLSVRVSATAAGYLGTGHATSAPTAPVAKAVPDIEATLPSGVQAHTSATVAVRVTGPGIVDGTVTVSAGGVTATAEVVDGVADVVLPPMPVGTAPVTVAYSGAELLEARTLVVGTVTVSKSPVTMSLSVAESVVALGAAASVAVTVTAPAGAPAPSGQVTVAAGGVTAFGALNDGQATVELAGLPIGSHDVSASWPGTDRLAAGSAQGGPIVIGPAPLSEPPAKALSVIAVDVPAAKIRPAVQATIRVAIGGPAGAVATGAVTVTAGGKSATGVLVAGVATVRLPKLSPGTYPVTVTYAGDDALAGANASAGPLTVAKTPPAVTVVLPKAKVKPSQRAVIKVRVKAVGVKNVGGKVTVSAGGKKVKANVKKGKATLKLPKLKVGTYTVKVVYSGTSLIDKRTRNGVTLKVAR
jgi:hypothetical protein